MKKFIVDENVGHSVVRFLIENGCDVKYVTELYPSRDDIFILELAYREERILITNDKDFGHLIFKLNLRAISIILFRFNDELPEAKVNALKYILDLPDEKLLNHIVVVSENKIRIRPLKI